MNATSGEAKPLDPFEFLQFVPGVGALVAAPLSGIISGATKKALDTLKGLGTPAKPILPNKNPLTGLTKALPSGKAIQKVGTRTAVTAGSIFGTTAVSSYFLSTPQGQNTVNTFERVATGFTDFMAKNPLIPLGIIAVGGILAISLLKK